MKKTLLAFIQEEYYKDKLDAVLNRYPEYDVIVVSRKEIIFVNKEIQNVVTEGLIQVIAFLLRFKDKRFNILLASNVDDFIFHIIFRFMKFDCFETFDEGQRNLIKEDHYFKLVFDNKGQKRYKLLNTLFGFPLPYGKYFKKSDKHYTFYDPNVFEHALDDHKNLVFIENAKENKKIKKIFIGVSSNWFFNILGNKIDYQGEEYYKKLKLAAKRINRLFPDLYLMHPRETNELVNLLDERIIVTRNPKGGNESLINAMNKSQPLKIFTERSGLVFDIDQSIEVVFLDLFDRIEEGVFQQFIDSFNRLRNRQGSYKSKCIKYIFEE